MSRASCISSIESPRCGEVYNLGGGKDNSCSILEAFDLVEKHHAASQKYRYVDENRIGDHICYYSDLRKMKPHYPSWTISYSLPQIIEPDCPGLAPAAQGLVLDPLSGAAPGHHPGLHGAAQQFTDPVNIVRGHPGRQRQVDHLRAEAECVRGTSAGPSARERSKAKWYRLPFPAGAASPCSGWRHQRGPCSGSARWTRRPDG